MQRGEEVRFSGEEIGVITPYTSQVPVLSRIPAVFCDHGTVAKH